MRRRYTVLATRSGRWWALSVPDVPGVFSQSRTIKGIDHMARDVVSLMLKVPEDSFDLAIEFVDEADHAEALAGST